MSELANTRLLDGRLAASAAREAFVKLNPATLWRNPVIFVTEVVAFVATILWIKQAASGVGEFTGVIGQICAWLWFTVLFANFAEAVAEGRGRARAESLRRTQAETTAHRVVSGGDATEDIPSSKLRENDVVLVSAGDIIPGDGEVIEGIASIDESAITGESAPVIRESGSDRSGVTGGTRVVSDQIKVRITARPGESFLDRMIRLVEGAERQKTPNEIALSILLIGLTIIFLVVTGSLEFFAAYSGATISIVFLIALLVTLIPTTIGGLLSAIGIAGMDRLVRSNVVAKSGRAVEAAGDVDVLLLDKTGTITFGNRMADDFIPAPGISIAELANAALIASLSDDTPEGKSIVRLATDKFSATADAGLVERSIEFSAFTRMSGADLKGGEEVRKGAVDAIIAYVSGDPAARVRTAAPEAMSQAVERISKAGGTPLAVARSGRLLGVIHLKDIIKPGIRERFGMLRQMGIRTVMVTGDNPLTAATIAAEAGVDDYLAEATPERKLELIRSEQREGRLVAMCGDGSNDAPALAQADVGVAMNSGTPAAKEAGNLIDLDSDPTKLIEVVLVGKQLLISRGALTTFSIANDVAKYFAIIPALFITVYPQLQALNVMQLGSPQSAILSAIIFNALIIIALIPLALRGVNYTPSSASALLRRNLLIYGLGGVVVPFIGIKAIDLFVNAIGLA
jgi:K+-transporting ATPase ATPase B chain